MLSILGSLLAGWILKLFGFYGLVSGGMLQLFGITITPTVYYFLFACIGALKSIFGSVGTGVKITKSID